MDNYDLICNPVFRYGSALQIVKGEPLSFDESNYIGNSLIENSQEYYLKGLSSFFERNNISFKALRSDRQIRKRLQLNPILSFPDWEIQVNGNNYIFRESLTVCSGLSKSKLWTSLSYINENNNELEYNQLIDIDKEVFTILSQRLEEFKLSYQELINKYKESTQSDKLELKNDHTFYITGIGTRFNINDILEIGQKDGEKRFLYNILNNNYEKSPILKPFLKYCNLISGIDINDMGFVLSNSVPVEFDKREGVAKLLSENKELYQCRQSLILSYSITEKNVINERYFSFGYDDLKWQEEYKYRNSNLSSRSIMMEVGRGY